ncbi:lysosomal acid phosphatase-like protein 3, partial [Dinothrombium tinctorium]
VSSENQTSALLDEFPENDRTYYLKVPHLNKTGMLLVSNRVFKKLLQSKIVDIKVLNENFQRTLDQEKSQMQRAERAFAHSGKDSIFRSFPRHPSINDYIEDLAAENPQLSSIQTIGRSFENREIKIIRIGKNHKDDSKPAIWIDAGIHAREWAAPTSALYIAKSLIQDYAQDSMTKKLVDSFNWYILPSANPDGYEYSHTIHRHGDRAITDTFRNDPYANEIFWPDGLGELTNKGKQRMFQLGTYFRRRYSNFFTENPQEVYAQSSFRDRNINSAQFVLNGAYPPRGHFVWNENMNWQSFPIKTIPTLLDSLLEDDSMCPEAHKAKEEVLRSKEYITFANQFNDLYSYLTNKSGTKIRNPFEVLDLIYDPLNVRKSYGLPLPSWSWQVVLKQIKNANVDLKGLMLKEIRKVFSEALKSKNGENVSKKLSAYSTHDYNIIYIMTLFEIFNMRWPPFGATLMFELYATSSGKPYMKMFYLNVTESEKPFQLRSPYCNDDDWCDFETFLKNTDHLIPKNWVRECDLPSKWPDVQSLTH